MDKVNILLVDDQPGKLLSYQAILAGLNENLVLARSGFEALQYLLHQEAALILLDVVMPQMDGFETATLIRRRPRLEATPIIFLTSYSTSDLDRLKGYELGAVDYVFAPVVPEILLAKVKVFVELYRKRHELAQANESLRAEIVERQRAQDQALQAEARLRELNQTLESRVAERTCALERRALELRELNNALVRSNQELDDFAYVASHDLKEPLRGLNNYAAFLKEDYADKLDDAGRDKLNTLGNLCVRMSALIDGLLDYSRLGRVDMAVGHTNLDDVLRDVLESLRYTLEEQRVRVLVPRPLPSVRCDRVRVGEVFRNLIANAVKYNENTEKVVEIGYAASENSSQPAVYFVRDNGIGIRQAHLETIFRIFKRLHGRDKFGGGTGVGLTIVKKIVERHGGRIWVESTPGAGSTFFFTLQAAAESHNITRAPAASAGPVLAAAAAQPADT